MSRRTLFGERLSTVVDGYPAVIMRDASTGQPTRASSVLRTYRAGSQRAFPVTPAVLLPGVFTPGAFEFTPCDFGGTPLRDPAPGRHPPPLAPPVSLYVVKIRDVPLGAVVLAPENLAATVGWDVAAVVGDDTHVAARLAGGQEGQYLALGRRVTWIATDDLQDSAGVAIFAGGRAAAGSALYPCPAVALDAFLPSGRVRFRGSDGTTFEAPGLGMLANVELPLPDQTGRVWIIEAEDRATTDPDPDPGVAFVCVNPAFKG